MSRLSPSGALHRRPLSLQVFTQPSAQLSSYLSTVLLATTLLLAAGARFYALDGSSLWSDEGNTWALTARSFTQIARDAAADIHPPGYYWLAAAWAKLFGANAWGLRSLSAVLGVALVWVVYRIGRLSFGGTASNRAALLAALIAALNPFQIYYSQEARMYMLLALEAACVYWALLAWFYALDRGENMRLPMFGYAVSVAAGLWTHYSFAIVPLGAGVVFLWGRRKSLARSLPAFVAANVAALLLFAPWLPTAVSRVLAWPKGGVEVSALEGAALTLRTLLVGPIRVELGPSAVWFAATALLPLVGLWALRVRAAQVTLGVWLLGPIALMAALGLYSDAFLKFLLTASPAWCLLVAAGAWSVPSRGALPALIAAGALALSAVALPAYYGDPGARDNYAGVARYVEAMGDPASDLVVLDAPGQQEVWSYYDPGFPVLALPRSRPPDASATEAELGAAIGGRRQVFALFWATDEADPERIVERRLDATGFKGLESWQGNLRFVVYAFANQLACVPLETPVVFGERMQLLERCEPAFPQTSPQTSPQTVAAGQTALVSLRWQPVAPMAERYKVTVQLLDGRGQVVAQHDAEPAGGSAPTDGWTPGETVIDNHGVTVPPGTPPGEYTLLAAVYDDATGARLTTGEGDSVVLGQVRVARAEQPIPLEIVPMAVRVGRELGPVRLEGYAAHRKDFSHAPETPIQPGDVAHFTFFWSAPSPLPADWPADATFTLRLNGQTVSAPLAGGSYPTGEWRAGELVRGEFDLLVDGPERRPTLEVGGETLRLQALP